MNSKNNATSSRINQSQIHISDAGVGEESPAAADNIETHAAINDLDEANLRCYLKVSIGEQTLSLLQYGQLKKCYQVSTGKNGIGSQEGSGCTPLGRHIIAEKIGADAPINSVFVGRRPTGEIYDDQLGQAHPERDWILSRILWLSGCEEGINKGCNAEGVCDTYQRYIYIHGTPDTEPMGLPLSHGCVRMRNRDIVELFAQVAVGTIVDIFV